MSTRRTKRTADVGDHTSSVIMSSRKEKRTADEAELSSLSDNTPSVADLIFSNPNDSRTRNRLWNWLDTKFTKQDEYIKEQSQLIKDMIAESKSSLLTLIEQKFNDFKNEIINDVKKEVKELNDRVTELETANVEIDLLKSDVQSLKLKCLSQENSAVAPDVRITGLPFYNNENLKEIFENICGSFNITVPLYKSIFRVKHFKNYRNVDDPPIVVKFNTPYEKNFFLRTAAAYRRKYKSPLRLSIAGFDSDSYFYVNENLTPHNYGIFKTALKLKKDNLLRSVYTQRGLVYVKQHENNDPLKITFPEELKQFFRSTD